jgi:hypothetical protein
MKNELIHQRRIKMPKIEEFCLFICFTAEAQRAQRENFFIKKLCDLCVSAVSYNFRHF